ncbi:hypothetical protein BV898_20040 [Hypsibius exemplaris]|uniref:Uncharacterized protein n=1 Tax=Hypsibius exemplaris TaxID=2072580 RepID=A0A9X6NKP9_HYPEX|nr:hypothetical protein BV898_20040 [Hypsibius exemplaris]
MQRTLSSPTRRSQFRRKKKFPTLQKKSALLPHLVGELSRLNELRVRTVNFGFVDHSRVLLLKDPMAKILLLF